MSDPRHHQARRNQPPLVVAVVGPESTGKTCLAQALAKRLLCPWVPEYARTWLDQRGPGYNLADLEQIARGQQAAQHQAIAAAQTNGDRVLVLDTDLLVIRVWSDDKFKGTADWVQADLAATANHYLLCAPDLPWQPDPLREDPNRGRDIHARYRQLIHAGGWAMAPVTGTGEGRTDLAHQAIRRWLQQRQT